MLNYAQYKIVHTWVQGSQKNGGYGKKKSTISTIYLFIFYFHLLTFLLYYTCIVFIVLFFLVFLFTFSKRTTRHYIIIAFTHSHAYLYTNSQKTEDKNMTHLDTFMNLWLLKKLIPDVSGKTLQSLTSDITEYYDELGLVHAMVTDSPEPYSYMMIYWLHNKGFSQKAIADLLNISQPTVSQAISRGEENDAKTREKKKKYVNKAMLSRERMLRDIRKDK